MSSAEFWDLTWYDWGGWIGRITLLHKRRELDLELQRTQLTWFAAAHGDKKIKPQDILKLSYDTEMPKEEKKLVFENRESYLKFLDKRFSKRKKKDG